MYIYKDILLKIGSRVAEVVQRHERPSPKSLDWDKNFNPQHTLLCRNIKICRDIRSFWKYLGKKSAFLGQNGQEMHYYMVGIANYTELNLQICNYAQNDGFVGGKSKYAFDEIYMAIFTLAERLPTSATLTKWWCTLFKSVYSTP